MEILQIVGIAAGIALIILSIISYFHAKSPVFIRKRYREILTEEKWIDYQRALAMPTGVYGILNVIYSIFFFDRVQPAVYLVVMCLICVWVGQINKEHTGHTSPRKALKQHREEKAEQVRNEEVIDE